MFQESYARKHLDEYSVTIFKVLQFPQVFPQRVLERKEARLYFGTI